MLDLLFGELQTCLGAGLVRLGSRESTTSDLDLNGDFQAEPGQCGLLPLELRFGRFDLVSSKVHLVAVGLRVDFRQHLILFDPIILLDEEGDEMPRHRLRGHVDDVRLHKGVFGDRMVHPIQAPQGKEEQHQTAQAD